MGEMSVVRGFDVRVALEGLGVMHSDPCCGLELIFVMEETSLPSLETDVLSDMNLGMLPCQAHGQMTFPELGGRERAFLGDTCTVNRHS